MCLEINRPPAEYLYRRKGNESSQYRALQYNWASYGAVASMLASRRLALLADDASTPPRVGASHTRILDYVTQKDQALARNRPHSA